MNAISKIEKLKSWKVEKSKSWKVESWKVEKLKNWKIEKLKNWKIIFMTNAIIKVSQASLNLVNSVSCLRTTKPLFFKLAGIILILTLVQSMLK